MEKVNLTNPVFDKVDAYHKEHPECRNFNEALDSLLTDNSNKIKALTDDNERWQNGIHSKNHELEAAKKRIEELEAEAAENGDGSAQIAELQEKLDKITAERDSIKATSEKLISEHKENLKKLADAEQRANENGENSTAITLENERLKEENEVLKSNLAAYESTKENATGGIVLQEATKKILERVAVKLSERYGKAIDVNQIVNMCILRYNIERYTAWFHPFVIDDADIEELTGKTRRDWMKFFNTNE